MADDSRMEMSVEEAKRKTKTCLDCNGKATSDMIPSFKTMGCTEDGYPFQGTSGSGPEHAGKCQGPRSKLAKMNHRLRVTELPKMASNIDGTRLAGNGTKPTVVTSWTMARTSGFCLLHHQI
ncbi:hypothetical protein GE21DRAFT_9547 [Neurospora crassa]|uniref:Uncharacterized protein n=1 Tax=Neurospora crassa (strain ATCC 24698 / 74-OR23-1A / CBS 708.71 / DSM 1257 / FGSC 987) TaxID=367110 RepID=Q7RXC6_NEUCR|nr:hypothetical protein NCU05058 [Neurospora crassa OR74A]EAA27196.1 hypothetical protein NCU05058 [Neurospora crassa OR74A]KHE83842.1 hypothetical protein GE21DRAFT_9547 [Neurospora crassa]|eukprot:XP_956432.1 hypothetical protein NCU05058 [Neurospora crassa OR74A]